MLSAWFIKHDDVVIDTVTSIDVGRKRERDAPEHQVLISVTNKPAYLLNIFLTDEADCFHELKSSSTYVVIGCGEKVHFFSVDQQTALSYPLNDYFGHLYPSHDIDSVTIENDIIVASASRLFRFSSNGALEWASEPLGIDGVVVNKIEDNLICGEGEYDPPGGWVEFTIRIDDGSLIT